MLAMLSEASIASWCSPSQASPSYTPSRRRLRLRHWCSPKQISLVQTPRAGIARLALAGGSMLLQNLASSLSKVLFTTQLASELASPGCSAGFSRPDQGGVARHSTGCLPPLEMADQLNSTESPELWLASEAIEPSAASRSEQGSAPHPQHAIEQFHQRAAPHKPCLRPSPIH